MNRIFEFINGISTIDKALILGAFILIISTLIFLTIAGIRLYKKFDKTKRYFFGWGNIKWLIKEFIKMYSNQPSFFSYKRFQVGTAFLTYQIGSRFALYNLVNDMIGFTAWAAIELTICGYTLNQIQKEKPELSNSNNEEIIK